VSPRERSSGRKPRQIAQRLAKLSASARTPRASELDEAGPESNDPRGATVAVESTRTSPGAGGVAVVAVPREIDKHTDDDARIVVDDEGKAEIAEPPALTRRRGRGVAEPEGDGSLEGEANTADPRKGADEGERKAVEGNADPGAAGSPPGGESMTSERVAGAAPRKATPGR
jgi:hypothetical protein